MAQRYHYKSWFDLTLGSVDVEGEAFDLRELDWRLVLHTSGRPFEASWIGGVGTNVHLDGDELHVIAARHSMGPGAVIGELTLWVPDTHYPDDRRKLVTEVDTGITLDSTGNLTTAVVEVSLPLIVRTAYDIARAAGYTGTREEYAEAAAALPSEVEAARNAASNANMRAAAADQAAAAAQREASNAAAAAAEASQVANNVNTACGDLMLAASNAMGEFAQAEEARSEAERARVEAESQRVEDETSRSQAEQSRVAAEQSRSEAESQREAAEAARETASATAVAAANAAVASANEAAQGAADAASEALSAAQSINDVNLPSATVTKVADEKDFDIVVGYYIANSGRISSGVFDLSYIKLRKGRYKIDFCIAYVYRPYNPVFATIPASQGDAEDAIVAGTQTTVICGGVGAGVRRRFVANFDEDVWLLFNRSQNESATQIVVSKIDNLGNEERQALLVSDANYHNSIRAHRTAISDLAHAIYAKQTAGAYQLVDSNDGRRPHWEWGTSNRDGVSVLAAASAHSLGAMHRYRLRMEWIDLTYVSFSEPIILSNMFIQDHALEEIIGLPGDLKLTGACNAAFACCSSLKHLDTKGWDTSRATRFDEMFRQTGLSYLDFSTWSTVNIINMTNMFLSSGNLRYITLGPAFFSTRVEIPFKGATYLGLADDNATSNGWLEHLAATAPVIRQADGWNQEAWEADKLEEIEATPKLLTEEDGTWYLNDGIGRTLSLPANLKNKEWAQPLLMQLQEKGYTIA